MSDLDDLYHELILDHSRHPRHYGTVEEANRDADGFNPLCGDRISLTASLNDGVVVDLQFQGKACAICTASASLMCDAVVGRSVDAARRLFAAFRLAMTTGDSNSLEDEALNALLGVRRFPMRVKCATLPWHTMMAALEQRPDPVSTE